MKKYILIFIVSILVIISAGCDSKQDKINALVAEGDNYFNGSYFDEANMKYIEALNIKKSEEVNEKLINSYITEGDTYYNNGDLVNAIARYDNAIKCLTDETDEELSVRVKGKYHIFLAKRNADKGEVYEQIKEQCEADKIVSEYNMLHKDEVLFDVVKIDGYEWFYKDDVIEIKNAYNFYNDLRDFYVNDVNLQLSNPNREQLKQVVEKVQEFIARYDELWQNDVNTWLSPAANGYVNCSMYWGEDGSLLASVEYKAPDLVMNYIKSDLMEWINDSNELPVEYIEIDVKYDSIIELYDSVSETTTQPAV